MSAQKMAWHDGANLNTRDALLQVWRPYGGHDWRAAWTDTAVEDEDHPDYGACNFVEAATLDEAMRECFATYPGERPAHHRAFRKFFAAATATSGAREVEK